MCKNITSLVLLAFAVLINSASCRPGYLPPATIPAATAAIVPATAVDHIEYAPTVVGHTVHSIPTAVSHQSQTIVHEKRPFLRPIVEVAPIVKTAAFTPYIKSSFGAVHHGPIVNTAYYAPSLPLVYASSPGLTYAAGSLYDHGWSSPSSFGGAIYGGAYSSVWPLK